MYNGVQNNYQDQTFYNLNRQFAGRGLAARAVSSAEERRAAGAKSAPMTLDEFTDRFNRRSPYSPVNRINAAVGARSETVQRPVQRSTQTAGQRTRARAADGESGAAAPRANGQRHTRPAARPTSQKMMSVESRKIEKNAVATKGTNRRRRAVKNEDKKGGMLRESLDSLALSVRQVPASVLFMVVLCAVSLMLIVSSSVLVSDASGDYSDIQDDVSVMAKTEDELLIALEVKNDLRTIENIAVNKLGMVNKDLVTRQYIKLGDEDIIETFEEEDRNVGLSTLLSAISKGN